MDAWLSQTRDSIARAAIGADLELTERERTTLLDLAAHAAHTSGDRTNAPLLCYLVGRAEGAASLDELAEAVRGQR
jgi:hypothetical protein